MGDDITPCVSGNARTLFLSNHINADDVFASYDFFNSRPVFPDNIMLGSFHPIKYCHLGLTLQWRRDIFLKQVSQCSFRFISKSFFEIVFSYFPSRV